MSKLKQFILFGMLIFVIHHTSFVQQQISSIFDDDTCLPPCWFGLVLGISTAADVDSFFKKNPNMFKENEAPQPRGIFDPETGYLHDGVYKFEFLPQGSQIYKPSSDRVYISDGIIDHIDLYINQDINLDKVLASLGMPDHVYISISSAEPEITLIYLSLRLRINFVVSQCNETVRLGSWMYRIRYYSERAAEEGGYYILYNEPLPRLTASELETEVLPTTWKTWFETNIGNPCASQGEFIMPSFDKPQTVNEINMLFEDNPCDAPCWFNLTPGISNKEDVLQIMQASNNTFDNFRVLSPDTYTVDWVDYTRYRYSLGETASFINLQNDTVVSIQAFVNRTILLYHVLDMMGQPDEVYISQVEAMVPNTTLYLVYREINVVILLNTFLLGCDFSYSGSLFWVDSVYYTVNGNDINLKYKDYSSKVPDNVWDAWLNNEIVNDCSWLEAKQ